MTENQSTLTCPLCGHRATEKVPKNACQWRYECKGCGALLTAKKGDCCVHCSYGTEPRPPVTRQAQGCC